MMRKKLAAIVAAILIGLTGTAAGSAPAQAAPHAGRHIVPTGAGGGYAVASKHKASAKTLTAFNGAGYYYAGGSQTYGGTDFSRGLGANIFISKPFVPNTPNGSGTYDHSLLDLIVNETTSGVAGNAMEAFVAVEPNVWGNFNPHLGVCAWHNSVDNGCYTGGANWVDNPDTDSGAYSAAFTAVTTTRSIYIGGAGYKFVSGVATAPGNVGSC